MQSLARLVAHRHPALAIALADDAHLQAGQIEAVGVQAGQLADP